MTVNELIFELQNLPDEVKDDRVEVVVTSQWSRIMTYPNLSKTQNKNNLELAS